MAKHRQHITEFNLFLKAEKSLQFLGYNISKDGITMDEGKVQAIHNWPIPSTVKELQHFLGFANFYHQRK